MAAAILFIFTIAITIGHVWYKNEKRYPRIAEIFLSYILLINMGFMGLLAAYAHVFMGPEIAREIGWPPGSPFQFEIGMANLSYGILGILAFWIRKEFWLASILGWSVLLLGCFVGHILQYYYHGDTAPLNIGVYVWFNDLFLPLLALGLLFYIRRKG